MPAMTTQTEKHRRLAEQIVGHRSVRLMANRAILGHRRMLIGKRALFVGVAPVADQVDRRLAEIALRLTVTVVAVRADHLPFLDGMVLRHRGLAIDIAVTFVAHEGLVNRHWQPRRAVDIRVLNVDGLRNIQVGMRIVAVRAAHAAQGMNGGMPGHGRTVGAMALQA